MMKRKPYISAFAKSKLMAKGGRRSNPLQFSKSKRCKTMALEDEISALPDDILLHILSLLTFKEAVATSILSRRWRYLWTSLPSLNFTHEEVLQRNNKDTKTQLGRKLFGVYKDQFIQTVNHVLRLYKGLKLHDFAIHYPFEITSSCHIDLWVAYAIAIGVSRLELNFSQYPFPIGIGILKNYSIPLDLFDEMKGIESYLRQLDDVLSIRTSSFNVQNRFKSLRELFLKFVDLTDELFETILISCTSLEHLYLFRSRRLVNVRCTVPHLKLKCLEIIGCKDLESMEIFTPNLVSFQYRGPKINIFVRDAKQLVNLCMRSAWSAYEYPLTNSLGCTYPRRKDFVFGQFAAYLSQLQHLVMDVSSFEGKKTFSKVPLLSNLKHLSLTSSNDSNSPYGVVHCHQMAACFIKASPFLHRLELHFLQFPEEIQALRRIPISPHKYLKEVLVSGFLGDMLVTEFIMSIFDYAIALEKIDITTAYLSDIGESYRLDDQDYVALVRNCIRRLRRRLPRNAQLNFLDDD